MLDKEYSERLNDLLDDTMVQFPMVARKILAATRSKTNQVSSDLQFRLLISLMIGPMTPTEISQDHCISKPNVTSLINKLIEGGLAQRSHDEKDKRVVFVTITDKGRKAVYRKRKIIKAYMLEVFAQFDAAEIEQIFSGVEKFRNLLIKLNNVI